ncbi:MAG: endolytic transglycosylase MltG [Spirochaetaceae bacterium]
MPEATDPKNPSAGRKDEGASRYRVRRGAALLLTLFLVGGLAYGGWYAHRALVAPKHIGEASGVFTIETGQSLDEIAGSLQRGGYIRSDLLFSLYARLTGMESALQAGDYYLSGTMSAREVLAKIVSGDAVFDEIEVTIPEGHTVEQLAARFADLGLFDEEAFIEAARMRPEYRRRLWILEDLPDGELLEGYLFPDTYRVFADSTPETVVTRMARRLQEHLGGDLMDRIEENEHDLHEILTLASIVQRESPTADMSTIAGVFWNRIDAGWLIESDATVNYALGTSKLQPTYRDTMVDHPYNTYQNRGLPPGPIGSPGLEAIEAAIDPVEHDYYFFLHKPSQETVLSRTFTEHLTAKRRYLD